MQLRPTGGEYKVYKNTLARFAARNAGLDDLDDLLIGPTGITFVERRRRRRRQGAARLRQDQPAARHQGRSSSAARSCRPRTSRHSPTCRSREVLLAQFAGALQAPLVKMAGLLQALPRNFAYGLKALIDQKEAA